MENLTNKVFKLENGASFLIVRQASYKGDTYYFASELTDDGEDFTGRFAFVKDETDESGNHYIKQVKDADILKVLANNIKLY